MVARPLVLAGVAGLLLASPLLAGPALGAPAHTGTPPTYPPKAVRIAATNATYAAIEAKIAAHTSLRLRGFANATAQEDIIDYGVNDLWKQGIDGAGVTVAFVVTNPDPGLAANMTSYDTAMDLPPANVSEMTLPATGPFTCQIECDTTEDRLDAESIHSMAPYANLLFVSPSVPETIGIQGWPQVAQAIEMIANEHLANIITVSLGDGEGDFINDPTNPGASEAAAVHSLDPAFLDAAAHNIPVMFASGDCGPTDPTVLSDTGQCTPAIGVTDGHPADNPWVTAVGGTIPNAGLATTTGRTAPDALWTAPNTHSDAESAGVSTLYPQPSWQADIPALAGLTGRADPDITMDSSNGTSQASPTFAGVLALATQYRHADLGTVNPALSVLGPQGAAAGIVDVPSGYNDNAYGVTGYATGTGYDIASGWGTIYAPDFVPALVHQLDSVPGSQKPSRQAHHLFLQLERAISASPRKPTVGQTVTITGKGFIPGSTPNGTSVLDGYGVYPPLPGQYGVTSGPYYDPTSTVPGQTWDDITATISGPGNTAPEPLTVSGPDGNGNVTASINTTGWATGTYKVTFTGRLITQTVSFTVRNPKH
ncbi:MAG TPA: S8 family serine peptidase [Streptosporangiaceae bacterium]|nr:S8 family serine peptidase [Streptosporangiaceae bacterium]